MTIFDSLDDWADCANEYLGMDDRVQSADRVESFDSQSIQGAAGMNAYNYDLMSSLLSTEDDMMDIHSSFQLEGDVLLSSQTDFGEVEKKPVCSNTTQAATFQSIQPIHNMQQPVNSSMQPVEMNIYGFCPPLPWPCNYPMFPFASFTDTSSGLRPRSLHEIQMGPRAWEMEQPAVGGMDDAFQNTPGGGSLPTAGPPTNIKTSKSPRVQPWTDEEHELFLVGLLKFGRGNWRIISRECLPSRNPAQIASHAQKFFLRQKAVEEGRDNPKRPSIHDTHSQLISQVKTTAQRTTPSSCPQLEF